MENRILENKYNILKLRISNLIEEHTDALGHAQFLHQELDKAKEKISNLEERLKEKDVQKKEPTVTIVDEPVDTAKN